VGPDRLTSAQTKANTSLFSTGTAVSLHDLRDQMVSLSGPNQAFPTSLFICHSGDGSERPVVPDAVEK